MKKNIIWFITGVLLTITVGASAVYLYNAKDIEFNSKDTNWNVNNVEDAINDIKNNYMPNSKVENEYVLKSEYDSKVQDLNKLIESAGNKDYSYTGNVQSFSVLISGTYKIELWGAGGNEIAYGGYTAGDIHLDKGENLYIYVGGSANSSKTYNSITFNNGTGNSGGWNGGGSTDIRLVGGNWNDINSIRSRIMVAGAGGSASTGAVAGAGGGLLGYSGGGTVGGTQTTYGAAQSSGYTTSSFGIANGGCTGGNGYYPGGGATCASGAGGGSSFISGHEGCNAINASGTHTGQSVHYSGKKFTNTVMIDGKGYKWTNVKGSKVVGMPKYDGTTGTMTGNSGNGYARITLISLD